MGDSTGIVETKFFQVDYQTVTMGEKVGVKAEGYLYREKLPERIQWLDAINFTTYLSEKDGTVIDSQTVSLLPRKVVDAELIPFEVTFDGDIFHDGDVFISFGYSFSGYKDQFKRSVPFFAKEGAVTH